MRRAIVVSCAGSLAAVTFSNGLLLLLFTAIGFSSSRIMVYLSLPQIVGALLTVPFAVLSDRYGKKRCGAIGIGASAVGFTLLAVSALAGWTSEHVVAAALLIYTTGNALFASGWFAMLGPITPEQMRGRFFARMRISWQSLNILFAVVCALYLSAQTPLPVFGTLLALIALALGGQFAMYLGIPELEPVLPERAPVRAQVMRVLRAEGFSSFCAYLFLLTLATAAGPILFGLVEKRVLGYGDDLVMWMGNLYMIGAVLGFAAGGRMVDRFGTKPVFLTAHFGYALVLAMFVARPVFPSVIGMQMMPVAMSNFLYGFMWAFASIAVSTEMYALIPAEYKSLSTSICLTFTRVGASLAGILAAAVLDIGALAERWTLGGAEMSRYDTVLLFCAAGVVLLVVTLGLVPSVIHKAQWAPRQY